MLDATPHRIAEPMPDGRPPPMPPPPPRRSAEKTTQTTTIASQNSAPGPTDAWCRACACCAVAALRSRRGNGGVGPELGEDRIDAGGHARADVALAEFGDDLLVDDDVGQRVGQDGLEAIADLDPQLAVVGRDDEDRAGVLALLADAPRAAELIAIVLDRHVAERRDRRDDDLVAAGLLERGELVGQRRDRLGRQDVRGVDDIAGERRELDRRGRRAAPNAAQRRRPQGDEREDERREAAKAQNFTVGATWALTVVALNGTIGLAP